MTAPDLRRLLGLVLGLGLMLLSGSVAVLAHGDAPAGLRVHPEVVRPGSVLELTGADFGPGLEVEIGISSGLGMRQLSAVIADVEGHFFDAVLVPADLPSGIWEVRVRDRAGTAAVAAVVIEGSPAGVLVPTRPSTEAGPAAITGLAPVIAAGLIGLVALFIIVRLVRRATATASA